MARSPNTILRQPAVQLTPIGAQGRVSRKPKHTFHVTTRPWVIQPIMIAPVLPGETMERLLFQVRARTDAVDNQQAGWWMETYFFYVKHRDLDGRDDFSAMVLEPGYDLSSYVEGAAIPSWYCAGGGINWLRLCTKRVVEEYFRNEGEAWDDYKFDDDSQVVCSLGEDNFWQSLVKDADLVTATDVDVDISNDGTITASEVDQARRQWEWARANQLTQMTYEDFLGTYGVRPKQAETHKPELLRYVREWTYPDAAPQSSAATSSGARAAWSISEAADKSRFFREPGFIVGYVVFRPKVYLSNQVGYAASQMRDAYAWLPAVMRDDPLTSLIKQEETLGLAPTISGAYWFDARDLLLYGDQFVVNNAGTSDLTPYVALPSSAGQARYPAETDADALFLPTGTRKVIELDGVVSLDIKGNQTDTTP